MNLRPSSSPPAPASTVSLAQTRAGNRLAYEEFGPADAPTVLFIRGTGADGRRWMPQINDYCKHFRCVIFDNRGVGESDTPPSPYTVEDLAEDTLDLMDHLGIEAAHLSGSSLGGAVAMHVAAYFPERVHTLQIHSSWLSTINYAGYSLGLLKRLLLIGGVNFYYEASIPLLFSPSFLGERFPEAAAMLENMIENACSAEGLMGQIEANLTHDLAEAAASIGVPTLVTVGELDLLLPVAESRRIQQAIPNADLIVFPGGGHLVSVEDPALFNRLTLDWLNQQL